MDLSKILIAFDWDDTLLASTYLSENKYNINDIIDDTCQKLLNTIDLLVIEILSLGISGISGTTV